MNDLLCTFAELKTSWFYLPRDSNKTPFFKCSDRDAMSRDYKQLGPIFPKEEVVPIEQSVYRLALSASEANREASGYPVFW